MRNLLLTCALSLLTFLTQAQQISIQFDFSNATTTLRLLQKSTLTEADVTELLSLPGTKALLQKIKSHPDTARTALTRVIQGLPSTQQGQNFGYRRIKRDMDSLQLFISTLEQQKQSIANVVTQALIPYVPAGKTMNITVYGTLGGYSSAYTLGNDSHFYLGLQFYKNDVTGVVESCKHELFHNLQAASYNSNSVKNYVSSKDKGLGYAYSLLNYLFKEGSAEYIADLRKTASVSPYVKELWEHMAVNEDRTADAFYLVERTILDAAQNSSTIDFNKTYNLLFSWQWNNPGYFVGYSMTKSLTAACGETILKKYLATDPVQFVLDYIELTKTRKDLAPFAFSAAFEKAVQELAVKVKRKPGTVNP
jgi:hypothetical protein